MASSIINAITGSYTNLTLNSGFSGYIRLVRYGNLRIIMGAVRPTASGTQLVMATIPVGDRPPVSLQTPFGGYAIDTTGEVSAESNGNLILNIRAVPNNDIKFNATYAV